METPISLQNFLDQNLVSDYGWLHINQNHNDLFAARLKDVNYCSATNTVKLQIWKSHHLLDGTWRPAAIITVEVSNPSIVVERKPGKKQIFHVTGKGGKNIKFCEKAVFKEIHSTVYEKLSKRKAA